MPLKPFDRTEILNHDETRLRERKTYYCIFMKKKREKPLKFFFCGQQGCDLSLLEVHDVEVEN
jgi:hypothetical protein